jgi:hypothetical protein
MLLSKGMKSLQLSLNEFIPKLKLPITTVTAMAYSKARRKLSHTAFIALNELAVIQTMYEDGDYKTWCGLRVFAVDGSKVRLPFTPAMVKEFGTIAYNERPTDRLPDDCFGLASVLYDVMNKVAIDARLLPGATPEPIAAELHLPGMSTTDLTVFDRNYASYRMLAMMTLHHSQFLVRCSRSSFKPVREMFDGHGPDDQIVTITPNHHVTGDPDNAELPLKLRLRLVRVTLDNGEYEVLATSLIDQVRYRYDAFKELYHLRWGEETFYGKLKTRLGLENFSGYSPEAVRQDFHVAVLLTGVETIFTEDAEYLLTRQQGKHPQQVNKAVSFNAIKHRAFELFMSDQPPDDVLEQLTQLFTMSPVLVRPDKRSPRGTLSAALRLQFVKRRRKIVF